MQRLKRLLAGFLTLVMLFSSVPVQAFAVQDTNNTEASVDTQDVELEGTNAVGNLLVAAIAEEQQSTIVTSEDTSYEDGYTLTEIVVQGSVATVTYDALEEAHLVVALYSDDGMQLLNTAKTMVNPEETTATVTFSGTMPQYFVVSAYLLDVYDYSPLCPSYETPMYTSDMQELLAMTVADCVEEYGEERIYNLDDSADTNFAVYAEGTVLLYEEDGVNTVTSADDENLVYVLENADERVTSLTEGSIVVYEYADGELLLMKVSSIAVDGTTVTIQGADMEIEEVFALMKVEGESAPEDATFDDTDLDECVEYLGQDAPQTYAFGEIEGGGSATIGHTFYLWGDEEDSDSSYSKVFEGTLKINLTTSAEFYISRKRQFVEFKLIPGVTLDVTVGRKYEKTFKTFGEFTIPVCYGVKATAQPQLKFKFEGKIHATLKTDFQIGFSLEHRSGNFQCNDLTTKPISDFSLNPEMIELNPSIDIKAFFGICFNPGLELLSSKIAEGKLDDEIGIELTASLSASTDDHDKYNGTAATVHDCAFCVDGALDLVVKHGVKFKFLNSKSLTFNISLLELKFNLLDFYYSLDNLNLGLGDCPNLLYRVYITVKDKDENIVEGAPVWYLNGDGTTQIGISNVNGVAMDETSDGKERNIYLEKGSYTFQTVVDGEVIRSPEPVPVYSYTSTVLTSNAKYWERQAALKLLMIQPDSIKSGSIRKSGECGDDLKWRLYTSGLLEITGTGAMDSYSAASKAPWYKYKDDIKSLRIGEPQVDPTKQDADDLISVSSHAFSGYTALKKVILEDNVKSLGLSAFYNCTGLDEIKMPVDLDVYYNSNSSSNHSFTGCTNVTKIHYTYGQTGKMTQRMNSAGSSFTYSYMYSLECTARESLQYAYVEDGITNLSANAFYNAAQLQEIYIPQTINTIGSEAFAGCTDLTQIDIPEGLTTFGTEVFSGCTGLTSIYIPTTLTTIPEGCFSGCTGLTELVIPDNITSLGLNAFNGCSGITTVTMPVDLDIYCYKDYNSYYHYSFAGCTNVREICYTYGQTGKMTERKTSCSYPSASYGHEYSLEYLSRAALECVTFDSRITDIAGYAFYEATNLVSAVIPDAVTGIGSYAFYNCSKVEDADLPASLTSLGSYAFNNCSSLTKITIPAGITEIPLNCFSGCSGLTELVIPDNITVLHQNAFNGCSGITKATMPVDLDIYCYNNNSSIKYYSFAGCTNVREICYTYGQTGKMTERDTTCNYSSASYGYQYSLEYLSRAALKKVTFEAGILDVAASAFYNCTALSSALFLGDAPTIDSNSFSGVTADALYPYGNETWTEDLLQNYGGTLTWMPYILDENGGIVTDLSAETPEPEATEPEETEPTDPAETEPTDPTESEPTDPTETEPTDPTESEPTDPTESEPTDPTESEPTDPTESESTDPTESEPTDPTESEPTDPTESEPTDPTEESVPSAASAAPEEELLDQTAPTESEEEAPSLTVSGTITDSTSSPAANAVYGGMNEAEFEDATGEAIQTTSFSGLVAGSEYVMFALVSMDVSDLLAPDNILYIGQAPADDNGALSFRYIQRTPTDHFNVFACGAAHRHLKDASITFPKMEDNGELRIVEPTITYGGETLVEGVDYVVLDGQGATDAGDYLCTIRGICNYTGLITCSYTVDAAPEVANRITVASADLDGQTSVWIDGVEYAVQTEDDIGYVDLPDGNAETMIAYTYHVGDASDIHTQYPTGMKVWTLSNEDGIYTAARIEELDNILQYAGSSIRVTGKQGIRMITAIEKVRKNTLISGGLAGYTLKEYGTVVAWASQLDADNPLILGASSAKSNYAYKKGIADPVLAYDGDWMQYTNVLVGFSLDKCKDDIAMRPYMILKNAEGAEITLYGGIVQRSIGYIAYQNRNAFASGTAAYEYVWSIIHSVYGDLYDADYVA